MELHTMSGGGLTVAVKALGAELCRLQDSDGTDYLWPAALPWQRHAPNLFPIVGRLKDDTLRHDGQTTRVTQHGFARDRVFSWVSAEASACRLSLADDAQTRALYPFAFRFDVAYELDSRELTITYIVANPADVPLPASVGAHPAFRWPLREGVPKTAHRLVFDADEPDELVGVAGGLLAPSRGPSPIEGHILPLTVALFDADALILKSPRSRSVRYEAEGGPTIRLSWDGFRQLGIWSRRDADLLCIEPWYGYASPPDFEGDFADKPGNAIIPPGGELRLTHTIEVLA